MLDGISFQVKRSHFLQTNCVCVGAGDVAIVIDPGVFEDELDAIGEWARGFRHVHILYTHFDFDHIIDPPLDPGVPVTRWGPAMSRDRTAGDIIGAWERYDGEFYMERRLPRALPECDHWLGSSTLSVGGVDVRALAIPGHTADSTAYILPALGLAAVGDMLSDREPPLVGTSVYEYMDSLWRLAQGLKDAGASRMVPGHGSTTKGAGEWLRRAQDDVTYLRDVCRAGEEVSAGADPLAVAPGVLHGGLPLPSWHHRSHIDNIVRAARGHVAGAERE